MKYRIATVLVACVFAGAASAANTSADTSDSNNVRNSNTVRGATSPAFDSLDSNRDGVISKEEASRSSLSAKSLKSMDKNLDGKISKAEYESGGGTSEGPDGSGASSGGSP